MKPLNRSVYRALVASLPYPLPGLLRRNHTRPSTLYAKIDTSPQTIVASTGSLLQTADGTCIIDASAGASVVSVGHNDPRVKQAMADQLDRVSYTYNPFFTAPPVEQLAQFLTDSTGGVMSKVFFASSGTEAVEAALKMARQYFTELPTPQPRRTRFIARRQSYHGNTLGSLATGYHTARRGVYEPILAGNVSHVSPCYAYRDMREGESPEAYVARLADELDQEFCAIGPDTVCAFVAETVSGTVTSPPSAPSKCKLIPVNSPWDASPPSQATSKPSSKSATATAPSSS